MSAPIAVSASAGEPGFTPTAFLAVVEYVDPDGNVQHQIVASDGITPDRKMRLASHLTGTA